MHCISRVDHRAQSQDCHTSLNKISTMNCFSKIHYKLAAITVFSITTTTNAKWPRWSTFSLIMVYNRLEQGMSFWILDWCIPINTRVLTHGTLVSGVQRGRNDGERGGRKRKKRKRWKKRRKSTHDWLHAVGGGEVGTAERQ